MANEVNPIDELLRRADEMAEFPFKESDWERMSAKLDEEFPQSNTKPKVFWWKRFLPGVLMLLALVSGALWFVTSSDNPQSESIQQPETQSKTASPVAAEPIPNQTQDKLQTKENNTPVSATNKAESTVLNQSPIENTRKLSEQKSITRISSTPKTTSKNHGTIANGTEAQANAESLAITSTTTIASSTPKNKTTKFAKTNKAKRAFDKQKQVHPSEGRATLHSNTQAPQVATNNNSDAENKGQWVNGKLMQAADTQVQWQQSRMTADEMIRFNPRYVREALAHHAQRMDSVTVIRFKPVPVHFEKQVVNASVDSPFALYRLHAMVGTQIWRGFNGGPTWSPAPYVSIGIDKRLTRRLTLAAQVGFTYFNGLHTQNRTVAYHYKFGVDSTVYTAQHKMVFRIQWPVQLKMALNKHHALLAGGGAAWQPDGISKVNAAQSVFSGSMSSSSQSPMVTKHVLGYMHGIRAWDAYVQMGYQYQWHDRLAIQAIWQAGLRDMTNNQILGSNRIQRNSGLMLGLRYSFVRNQR